MFNSKEDAHGMQSRRLATEAADCKFGRGGGALRGQTST